MQYETLQGKNNPWLEHINAKTSNTLDHPTMIILLLLMTSTTHSKLTLDQQSLCEKFERMMMMAVFTYLSAAALLYRCKAHCGIVLVVIYMCMMQIFFEIDALVVRM